MSNRRYPTQFLYSGSKKPVLVSCRFKILSTAGTGVNYVANPAAPAGFGQPSANASYGYDVASVLGYSSSPATGNAMVAGNFMVTFSSNYYKFLSMRASAVETVTGSAVLVTTGLSLGTMYQITTVGTTTTAGWNTLGVPSGVTPAVGVPFVAATASVGTGTGAVKAIANALPYNIELAGEPNLTINPVGQTQNFGGGPGGYVLLQCWGPTDSTHTAAVLAQPADGTTINLEFLFEGA